MKIPRPSAPRRGGERGSVSLVAAGVMMLACVLCLMTVDLSRALLARARAQSAADAAVLAAAQAIAIPSGTSPTDEARTFAQSNGATLRSCQCEPGASDALVEVSVPVSFVFLGPDRTVTAQARAVIGIP